MIPSHRLGTSAQHMDETACALPIGRNVPADGGNGGKGGDVVFQAAAAVKSLRNVERVQTAPAGRAGAGHRQRGADGADLIVPVPCGTVILKATGALHVRLLADARDSADLAVRDTMMQPQYAEQPPRLADVADVSHYDRSTTTSNSSQAAKPGHGPVRP